MHPRGSSLVTSIASVVGLVLVGVGGYNLVTSGCVTGACSAGAAVSAVSTSSAHSCGSGCSEHGPKPAVVEASTGAEACCEGKGRTDGKACCGTSACSTDSNKDCDKPCDGDSKDAAPAAEPATEPTEVAANN